MSNLPESAAPSSQPTAQTPPETAGKPARSAANPRLVVLLMVLAAVVAVVDQLTKAWAQNALADDHVVRVIGDWLTFRLVYNPGAALSIATGMTWLLTIVVIVVIVMIIRAARRLRSRGWAIALGLLLGGAVGNLIDRLVRQPSFARGRVVDFIDYGGWFVGNVADIAIVSAACLIAILAVVGIGMDGRRTTEARNEVDAETVEEPHDPNASPTEKD